MFVSAGECIRHILSGFWYNSSRKLMKYMSLSKTLKMLTKYEKVILMFNKDKEHTILFMKATEVQVRTVVDILAEKQG